VEQEHLAVVIEQKVVGQLLLAVPHLEIYLTSELAFGRAIR